MSHVTLCPKDGRITVRRRLSGERHLLVMITPPGDRLVFAAYGRKEDSPGGPKQFYPYPGDVLGEDFLDPREHVVLAAGLEELAAACVGRIYNEVTVKLAIDVVRGLLDCAAGAPIDLAEAF